MLSGGDAIFGVRLEDDVTTPGRAMVASVKDLRANLRSLRDNFNESRKDVKSLVVGMAEARAMFKDAGGNVKLFQAALKDAGVSALDSKILVGKLTRELTQQRQEALATKSVWERMFDPRTIWVASHALNVLQKGWQGVGTAISVAQRVGGAIKDNVLDPVVDSAQYRETTLISLRESLLASGEKTDKGSADKRAAEIFKSAQKLAQETPLDTNEVIDAVNQLVTNNFSSKEAETLARVVADQSSIFGAEKGHNTITALARVKGRAFANIEDLDSFRTAGFSAGDISKALAKRMGIKGKDDLEIIAKVRKELGKSGNVGAYTFLNAVIASKEKSGGAIGDVAKANADSLKGSISNVKAAFSDLLQSTDIVKWPGVVAFKKFLNTITSSLSAESESGKMLLSAVQDITDSILGGLSNITAYDIASWIGSVKRFAMEAAKWFKEAWGWLKTLLESQGSLGEGLATVLVDIGKSIGEGVLKGMAVGAVKGTVGGITSGIGHLIGASESDITGAKGELLDMIGIDNGSAIVGESLKPDEIADRLGVPKLAGGGFISGPTLALVGEAGPEMVVPVGSNYSPNVQSLDSVRGGRGGVNVTVESVNVNVSGGSGDPDEMARAIEPAVASALITAFERIALER